MVKYNTRHVIPFSYPSGGESALPDAMKAIRDMLEDKYGLEAAILLKVKENELQATVDFFEAKAKAPPAKLPVHPNLPFSDDQEPVPPFSFTSLVAPKTVPATPTPSPFSFSPFSFATTTTETSEWRCPCCEHVNIAPTCDVCLVARPNPVWAPKESWNYMPNLDTKKTSEAGAPKKTSYLFSDNKPTNKRYNKRHLVTFSYPSGGESALPDAMKMIRDLLETRYGSCSILLEVSKEKIQATVDFDDSSSGVEKKQPPTKKKPAPKKTAGPSFTAFSFSNPSPFAKTPSPFTTTLAPTATSEWKCPCCEHVNVTSTCEVCLVVKPKTNTFSWAAPPMTSRGFDNDSDEETDEEEDDMCDDTLSSFTFAFPSSPVKKEKIAPSPFSAGPSFSAVVMC